MISDPDIDYLGLAREFKCFSKFEVCKHHNIIHDAGLRPCYTPCGAAKTIYNVGPGYWYANYPEGNFSGFLKSSPWALPGLLQNPFIGHITGLAWCWKNRKELQDIFGKL